MYNEIDSEEIHENEARGRYFCCEIQEKTVFLWCNYCGKNYSVPKKQIPNWDWCYCPNCARREEEKAGVVRTVDGWLIEPINDEENGYDDE